MEWTTADQALWECMRTALYGLKRAGHLSAEEYNDILSQVQYMIEGKEEKGRVRIT
jgi:hypothetical protein